VLIAFNWDFFVQQVVNGVTLGSVYALIALGYTMVYGILKLLNFAHGEVYMVGAFIGYWVLQGFGGPLELSASVVVVVGVMFVAAMLGCGVLGVAIERFAYRPLRNAPRIAPLISALGVSFFLQSSVLLLFGAAFRNYETYEFIDLAGGIHRGPLNVSPARILVVVASVALMIALTIVVGRTLLGKAMRATSYDREAASMMGINVDRVIVATFFIGSMLAGAAGVMFGLVFFQVWHLMGFAAGLKGFTAAVIGGIGSIPGAMLGGLVIGLAESLTVGYIETITRGYVTSRFTDLIVFLLLIVVLLVRPTGLLGRADIRKV
jgi:branched-chain amino acid transport system permease protein